MHRWTSSEPVEEGWYWIKRIYPKHEEIDIVYIRWYVGRLCIVNWDIPTNKDNPHRKIEWAGPLPLPLPAIRRRKHGKKKNKAS